MAIFVLYVMLICNLFNQGSPWRSSEQALGEMHRPHRLRRLPRRGLVGHHEHQGRSGEEEHGQLRLLLCQVLRHGRPLLQGVRLRNLSRILRSES